MFGTTVFLSWMPLKFATVTSFSQLHLSRNSGSSRSLDQIKLHWMTCYTRWLITFSFKETKKYEKLLRFFVGMENFTFLSSVVYYFRDLLKSAFERHISSIWENKTPLRFPRRRVSPQDKTRRLNSTIKIMIDVLEILLHDQGWNCFVELKRKFTVCSCPAFSLRINWELLNQGRRAREEKKPKYEWSAVKKTLIPYKETDHL